MNRDDTRTLAFKLRKCRVNSNLSQKQVADALGLDRSAYSCYERGTSMPSIKTLQKLAQIFHVEPARLLPDTDFGMRFSDMTEDFNPIYQLSKDERSVIVLYRAMSKEQKEELLRIIDNITKKDEE